MIKKSILFSLLLSVFSIQQSFGSFFFLARKFMTETPKAAVHVTVESAKRAGKAVKGKVDYRVAQYRSCKNYCSNKAQDWQNWYRDWRDFGRDTVTFVNKERNAIASGIAGLSLGWLITSGAEERNYEKQLARDVQDAVDSSNIHQIVFLAVNTQKPAIFADAMQYAVVGDKIQTIISLLQLRQDPQNPKSNYVIADPNVRMLGAAKISDMKTVYRLLEAGYDVDQAIEIARKVGNKVLLADLYRQKTGDSQDISLAVAALDGVGMGDFFAVGKRALKDKWNNMRIFTGVWEEPDINDPMVRAGLN